MDGRGAITTGDDGLTKVDASNFLQIMLSNAPNYVKIIMLSNTPNSY